MMMSKFVKALLLMNSTSLGFLAGLVIIHFMDTTIEDPIQIVPMNGLVQYEPIDKDLIIEELERHFNRDLPRLKRAVFYKGNEFTIFSICGYGALACVMHDVDRIFMQHHVRNICRVITHELLHWVVYYYRPDVGHHTEAFDDVISTVCEGSSYAR